MSSNLTAFFASLTAPIKAAWLWFQGPGEWRKFLVIGFMIVSFYGTYRGMLKVMAGSAGAEVSLEAIVSVGLIVALLTVSMVFALLMARLNIQIARRLFAILYYIAAVIVSVAFGFAFWWGIVAAKAETEQRYQIANQEYSNQLTRVRSTAAATRDTLLRMDEEVTQLIDEELQRGGTCDQESGPGAGPFWESRNQLSRSISAELGTVISLANRFEAEAQSQIAEIRVFKDRNQRASEDERVENLIRRNDEMATKTQELNIQFVEPLRLTAEPIAQMAVETRTPSADNKKCTDIAFAIRLDRLSESLAALPLIEPPEVDSAEGNASVLEAMTRLQNVFFDSASSESTFGSTDRVALLIASLIDTGLLLFAMLLPTDPLSGGFGGKRHPDVVRNRLREYAIMRPEAFADILDLRFSKGGRHFVVRPEGQWLKTDGSEQQDDAKPQKARLRNLKSVADHLDHANVLSTCIIPNANWWPWKGLVQQARFTLNDAGWIEHTDAYSEIDDKKSRLQIYHGRLADIDAIVTLQRPVAEKKQGSHSALDVSGIPTQFVGLSAEASERINLILRISEDVRRDRRANDVPDAVIQGKLDQIFTLQQYLERVGIRMTGHEGGSFKPGLHRQASEPRAADGYGPNTVIEVLKPGFARREKIGPNKGEWVPIVQAAVICTPDWNVGGGSFRTAAAAAAATPQRSAENNQKSQYAHNSREDDLARNSRAAQREDGVSQQESLSGEASPTTTKESDPNSGRQSEKTSDSSSNRAPGSIPQNQASKEDTDSPASKIDGGDVEETRVFEGNEYKSEGEHSLFDLEPAKPDDPESKL